MHIAHNAPSNHIHSQSHLISHIFARSLPTCHTDDTDDSIHMVSGCAHTHCVHCIHYTLCTHCVHPPPLHCVQDFGDMNEEWIKWIDPENKPVRACVEAPMAHPDILFEVMVTAAK